jgi:hypothetical protein
VVGWTLRPVAGRPLFGAKKLFVVMLEGLSVTRFC